MIPLIRPRADLIFDDLALLIIIVIIVIYFHFRERPTAKRLMARYEYDATEALHY